MSLDIDVVGLEPTSFKQDFNDPKWREVISKEFNALLTNDMWDLVPSQLGQNLVGCKWVFRVKFHSDGSVERHKARLVAYGITSRLALTVMRHSVQLSNPPPFILFFLLPLPTIGLFTNWTLTMLSYMVFSHRKFT